MHQPSCQRKYNIVDAIQSSSIFRDLYAVMVYDNIADDFLMLYSSDERATHLPVKSYGRALLISSICYEKLFQNDFAAKIAMN